MQSSLLTKAAALILGVLALWAGRIAAQTKAPPPEKDPVKMLKEISDEMAKVEELLLKAEASRAAVEASRSAAEKLDKLLEGAKNREAQIIKSLDELISEIRKRQRERKSKSSSSQQQKRQRNQRRPDDPQRDPKFNNRPEAREHPQRRREQPKKSPANRKPPQAKREKAKHPDKEGVWGRLPDKLFKLITNREQTVFPVEFQLHVEEYFKRLAESK